jgi:uncharacterized membrane protein YfcA
LTLETAVYSGLVLLLAYWVRGMAGFGSGLIAVPLLTLAWPVTVVVPLVVALDYIGSASQGIRNVDEVSWREQLVLIPFMVVGGPMAEPYFLTSMVSHGNDLTAFVTRPMSALILALALLLVLGPSLRRWARGAA